MKKTRLRLKGWVKEFLVVFTLIVVSLVVIVIAFNKVDKTWDECEEYYGRTCSWYEVDQYGKGVRYEKEVH